MGVTMSTEELDEFIGTHGDAVLTTLRADGRAAPMPVWYVAGDGALFFRTSVKTRRLDNIKRDSRVTVLISAGAHWAELRGVVLQSEAIVVEDLEQADRIREAFDREFQDRVAAPSALPEVSAKRYAVDAVLRVPIPAQPTTWDNRKLRLRS